MSSSSLMFSVSTSSKSRVRKSKIKILSSSENLWSFKEITKIGAHVQVEHEFLIFVTSFEDGRFRREYGSNFQTKMMIEAWH